MLINTLIFIVSVIIGSFLNAAIYRIPRKESLLWPGSHCPRCGHELNALDLFPVLSYMVLGGKCRYCEQDISLRYPLVELLTAISYMLIYFKWGFSIETGIGWLFSALLIIAAFTDIEEGIIPDLLTYPGIILGLGLSFYSVGIRSSTIGLILFAGILLLAALLSKGGMGGGDIKLAGVIGTFLGYKGSIITLFLSSLGGGWWAVVLLLRGKAQRKTAIKYGPFLAAAAWLVWMYGREISDFYWRAFL
jgi:leader peptidase (prepilin peptidase)/N-methyltransferase